jgi:hypothetical protein
MPPISIVLPSPLLEVMNCAKADGAAGAALVVDGHAGHDLVGLQRGLQRAARLVPATARRSRHDDLRLSSAVAQGVASSKAPLAMAVERRRRTSTIFMGLVSVIGFRAMLFLAPRRELSTSFQRSIRTFPDRDGPRRVSDRSR